MNLSLEISVTSSDLRQLMAASGSSRFSLIRILIGVIVLFVGFQHLSNVGLDWYFALHVVIAIYLISNRFIVELLFAKIMWFSTPPPTYRISIDDQSILIEQAKYRQEILWTSFAMTGTAREFENHFWLECGRGTVWIPKRAFPTNDDLKTFRALVKDKMGERCQFSP